MLDRLSRSLAALSAISLIVVALILVVDVLHRNISGRSIAGAFELVETIVVMIAFLGIMHAERSRTNVRITFVTARMSARLAGPARLVGTVVNLIVAVWFTVATWSTAVASTARGEFTQGLVAYPTWPAKLIIAVGFTALTLQVAVDLIVRSLAVSSDRTVVPAPATTLTPTPTPRHV
ncbi:MULTISPECIES: TRAP transporter small permease [unclassified Pseudonocardia]|uniref:TRAP transporter small permease subunit n=1 Tax=unclassified Pseudonocardia TaxID=2619320 RepID=UPI0012F674CE|nr:TRAP transporter small permease [Pseudonocardia sp. Ae707_Ps1]